MERPLDDRYADDPTRTMAAERGAPARTTRTHDTHAAMAHDVHHRSLDWGAIMASVVSGLAITATLIILGVATGLIAGDTGTDSEEAGGILGALGAWSVIAAVIGTLVGSMLGGRLARWLDRGTLAYHALTSWGVATLLSLLLLSLVAIAFGSAATSAATTAVAAETAQEGGDGTNGNAASDEPDGTGGDAAARDADTSGSNDSDEENAEDAADALGGAGVALTIAMLLTLAASVAGWWIGSRKRLTDFEREDTGGRSAAV